MHTVCLLHNIIIDREGVPTTSVYNDNACNNNEKTHVQRHYNHYGKHASEVRETLKNYFVSPAGEIQFQYNVC